MHPDEAASCEAVSCEPASCEAAFFDLDKTVIAQAAMMAFAGSFYRDGLINRRSLVRGAWTQLCYLHLGADADRLAKIRSSVLAVTKGWQRDRVRQLVAGALAAVVDPIVYPHALDLIDEHRRAGRLVYIVSASPAEIVEPLARHLGVFDVIASHAEVDDQGCYTGQLARYSYGSTKADLMRDIARHRGIDLRRSWAYSDSATDLPMLEAVGHPVAVNPDRALRQIAAARGWEVLRFDRVTKAAAANATPLSRRRAMIPTLAVVVATTGGMTALWWWRRGQTATR